MSNKPARWDGRIRPFGEVLRDRIDSTLAIRVITDTMTGENESRLKLDAARIALDKCLPSLQAVGVRIEDTRPKSIHDVKARLEQAGVDPSSILQRMGERTIEDNVIEHDSKPESE